MYISFLPRPTGGEEWAWVHSPKKLLENGSKRSTMELEYWDKEVEKEELVSQWQRMPSSTHL